MKTTLMGLTMVLMSFASSVSAQLAALPESVLKDEPTYESLSEALDYPEQVYKLDLLYKLDYSHLPEDIGELFNLRILILGHNNITKLPRSFRHLTKLQHLDLGQNPNFDYDHAWSSIQQLKEMEVLFLHRSGLTTIPSGIKDLQKLRWLNLAGNPELDLSSLTNLTTLKELKILDLGWGDFTNIPESVGKLQQLEELTLKENKLQQVPACLKKLKNLKVLDLSDNSIPVKEIETLKKALPNTKIYH